MEIKASIPLFKIRFKKLYNSYVLKILKFKEKYLIKKVYIKENNKNKDELADSSSSSFSSKNSIIRYLLQLKI